MCSSNSPTLVPPPSPCFIYIVITFTSCSLTCSSYLSFFCKEYKLGYLLSSLCLQSYAYYSTILQPSLSVYHCYENNSFIGFHFLPFSSLYLHYSSIEIFPCLISLSPSLFIFIPESFVSLSRACVFPVFLSASPEVTKACWWRNGRKYEEGEVKRCFVYLYSTSPTLTYTYSFHVVLFPLFIFKLPLLVLSLIALSIFFHLSCSIQ